MEIIPITLGCLFSIICLVAGVIYVAVGKGRARWRGLLIILAGSIGLLPLLMVMPVPVLTAARVSGTYEGNRGIGPETLVVNPSGTFDQVLSLVDGKERRQHGTWTIEGSKITFAGILDVDYRPESPGLISTQWTTEVRLIDGSLVADEDSGLYMTRVK
jgi:hypothetical protein